MTLAVLAMLLALGGILCGLLLQVCRRCRRWRAQIAGNAEAGSKPAISQLLNTRQTVGRANGHRGDRRRRGLASGGDRCRRSLDSPQLMMSSTSNLAQDAGAAGAETFGPTRRCRVSEEEARKAQAEPETRLAELTKAQTAMQQELDQRRQMEKSLAQQAQQLERSKDVLEMHVQARTQELQKLQRRNELILNSAGEGICGFDLQGRATFVNPAAAKITGWKIDEMIGKSEDEIFFPAAPKGAQGRARPCSRTRRENLLPEQIFYRKDGSTFPVEYVRTPIKENGKVVGAVVMFKDITERQLARTSSRTRPRNWPVPTRELEQFAFVASHDLQEPLRKIQAFGDRLKIKCEAVQLEEGRDYLERMQSAAARMQTLINDLLDLLPHHPRLPAVHAGGS